MMKRNFGNLSILFGLISVSLLVTFVLFSYFQWIRPEKQKANLITALERYDENRTNEYLNTIEFFLRNSALPFRADQVSIQIQKTLQLESVKLYDDSLRLIHSTKENAEVFHEELRQDPSGLLAGKVKVLVNGDFVYRDLSGKFFVIFPKYNQTISSIQNPNLEYGYLYWVFQPSVQKIIYTNDDSILSGDREGSELLSFLQGKEGSELTWQLDGEFSKLQLETKNRFSIYLLKQTDSEVEEIRFGCFLLFLFTFTGLFYIRFVWMILHHDGFHFKRRIVFPIIVYILLLFFYQKSWELFPDYRYYQPWTKHRLNQIEENLNGLEKNLKSTYQKNANGFALDETLVTEIYEWKSGLSNQTIQNRFGTEIFNILEKMKESPKSILIESELDLVYLIPIQNSNLEFDTILLTVINPNLLYAKKEKDKDEFYFPYVATKLSDNKSKEQVLFNPRHWNESHLTKLRHTDANKESVGFLHHKFHSYSLEKEKGIPGKLAGLTVYRYSSFPPYLLSFGLCFILPWVFFVFWVQLKRKWTTTIMLGESPLVPWEKHEPEVVIKNLEMPKEGIETKTEPIIKNQIPVKKTSFKILPPATWKRVAILDAIQKKRETIFNPELEKLVSTVTKREVEKSTNKPFVAENVFTSVPEEKRFEYSLLDKIYRENEISYDGIVGYTKNFISRLGSPRFSYLFLNDSLGSFHNQISTGLDYNTRSNLIFLHHDPYLQFDEHGFASLEVDESVRLDRFIAKKFSWEILLQTETIIAFHMETLGFPGIFLVLLNKEERGKFLESHKRMIQEKLKQVIPALHVLVDKEERKPEFLKDSLSWMIRSFMQATFGGKRSASVLRIHWPEYHPSPEWERSKKHFLDSIQTYLESKDRLIETSPNSLMVVSAKDLYLTVVQKLQELPFSHELKSMKFPEDGQNYYLYF
ncbi:hypothetical protein EHQ46_08355 [Leptospira yanagawae]|uniref:Uncharacterized protein n=1 Tax=Leptospira yanagawae TaxID=293069 RepID=A0ABY2M5B9_9LEPT|nr:hypothetical protein [Leptospira yanagawae]TGL21848.1 hypothetical protein EHQ46_08355 [Leptospira yanagawae]